MWERKARGETEGHGVDVLLTTLLELEDGKPETRILRKLGPQAVREAKALVEARKSLDAGHVRRVERADLVHHERRLRKSGSGRAQRASSGARGHPTRKILVQLLEEMGTVREVDEAHAVVTRVGSDGEWQNHRKLPIDAEPIL